MLDSGIQVLDFTSLPEPSDTVVLVRFEQLNGTVHIYRDGTVVLTTPAGTSVSRLGTSGDDVWRKELFLVMLARMGNPSQDLARAAQTADVREQALSKLGFAQAAQHAATAAEAHFKAWCVQREVDVASLDEAAVDDLLSSELAHIRRSA